MRQSMTRRVGFGSKPENLKVSKSFPLYLAKRTLTEQRRDARPSCRTGSRCHVQSFQKFLSPSGAISVYRTVCMMFLWPMWCWSARVSCPSLASL
jgi:hypothetical protein